MAKSALNILFVTHGYYPCSRLGGPIESVRLLAETLVQLGHTVTVLCTNSNLDSTYGSSYAVAKEELYGVTIVRFPLVSNPNGSLGFMVCRGMCKYLLTQGHRYDIYHVHIPFIYPTLVAALFSCLFNKPLIYHQRGQLDPVRLSYRKLKKRLYISLFECWILKLSKALIALTEKEIGDYLRIDSSIRSKVHLVPNPVVLPSKPNYYRASSYAKNEQLFKLFYLGRIHTLKGTPLLFEALSLLPDFFLSRLCMTIAGPDEQHLIPSLFNKYPMLVRDNIKYVGHYESNAKWELCLQSDAFILPSWSEGLSMSMLESLCAGNLLLLSDVCKIDNYGTSPLEFVRYFSLNPQSIAHAIVNAMSTSRDKLEYLKDLARLHSEKYYHPSKVGSSIATIYNHLLA